MPSQKQSDIIKFCDDGISGTEFLRETRFSCCGTDWPQVLTGRQLLACSSLLLFTSFDGDDDMTWWFTYLAKWGMTAVYLRWWEKSSARPVEIKAMLQSIKCLVREPFRRRKILRSFSFVFQYVWDSESWIQADKRIFDGVHLYLLNGT